MKNLRLIFTLLFAISVLSCSSDDDPAPTEGPNLQATINGGTFSDYNFKIGVYEIKKGPTGNTMSLQMADKSDTQFTIFLNGTNGFNSGAVKEMGNVDVDNFVTYATLQDGQSQTMYHSKSGRLKITGNREDPSNSKQRLLSGEFNIETISENGSSATLKGSFQDLIHT